MRKKILIALTLFVALTLCSCQNAFVQEYVYKPTGEFYAKTRPVLGDGGTSTVISLETAHATYEGEGDITVPMTVGFGHLYVRDREDATDTFYVQYVLTNGPWNHEDDIIFWEKKVEYEDSFFGGKYKTTEQINRVILGIPDYGEFYPLYTENIEITFPADVDYGYLKVKIVEVDGGEERGTGPELVIRFERVDGTLILENFS